MTSQLNPIRAQMTMTAASPLVVAGVVLMALGGAGDVAHHALPHELSVSIDPLVGIDGHRAHLAAFVGMLAILARVLGRGVRA